MCLPSWTLGNHGAVSPTSNGFDFRIIRQFRVSFHWESSSERCPIRLKGLDDMRVGSYVNVVLFAKGDEVILWGFRGYLWE
jgi:hypothetical protein